jgi:outer membrane receptor protein involved in Fe transport
MNLVPCSPYPRRSGSPLPRLGLIVGLALFGGNFAAAATASASVIRSFHLPAGTAAKTLRQFTEQSGIPVVFGTDSASQVQTNDVEGEFTPAEAMTQLLANTGLVASPNEKTGAITVSRDPKAPRAALAPARDDRPSLPAPALPPPAAPQLADDVLQMNPFTVEGTVETGYLATSSLAGTRLRTELRDIGSSISVVTRDFMEDLGATNSQSVLSYTTNFEVAGANGNYLGDRSELGQMMSPGNATRVRGLVPAINTRNFFRTNIRWDSYNVNRVDLQRGPNSVLFGLGSPGGVINAGIDAAEVGRNESRVDVAFDEFGTTRGAFNHNQVVKARQLAVRVAGLYDRKKYRQDPAFENDDRRFVAARYMPAFLNRDGRTFEVSADYEWGRASSNRPRFSTPVDQFTFFLEPSRIRPIQLPAGTNWKSYPNGLIPGATLFLNGYTANYSASLTGNVPIAAQRSSDGNAVRQIWSSAGPYWSFGRLSTYGARQANGTPFTGTPFTPRRLYGANYQEVIPATLSNFAADAGHPFANYFQPVGLTDPSIFDFNNTLIDGPNKREWGDFEQYRATLTSTFWQNRLGFEMTASREKTEQAQSTMLGANSRIFVDLNERLIDGRPNPDLGRPYLQETTFSGNRHAWDEITGLRASVFFQHDFAHGGRTTGLRRLLGRHLFNGVLSQETVNSESRSWEHYVYGEDLLRQLGWVNPTRRFDGNTRVAFRYYLGDDLRGRTSAAGTHLSNLSRYILPSGGSIPLRYFDYTWTAPASVSPAAVWQNPDGANWEQAANPANYRGWTTGNFTLVNALSGNRADYDLATRRALLERNRTRSRMFSWQAYLLEGGLVATYGRRFDTSVSRRHDAGVRPDQGANVDPAVYNLNAATDQRLEAPSTGLSLVGHISRLPVLRRLPVEVSLTYNRGENFDPVAGRRDVQGFPLPLPEGSTREYGVLLTTKENRFSLRVQRFETSVLNASSAIRNFTNFFGVGARSAYNTRTGILRQEWENNPSRTFSLDDLENLYAPAWLKFEYDFVARFPQFVQNWMRLGTWAPGSPETDFTSTPPGMIGTADILSRGYEIELVANPTSQLRLSLNASQLTTITDHAPGQAYREVVEYVYDAMFDQGAPSAAGRIRGSTIASTTMADYWMQFVYTNYLETLQVNGQARDEVVKWRFNGVANYTFDRGLLRGWSVGGAYRWEGKLGLGYPKKFDELGYATSNLDHPYYRDPVDRVDLTLRYRTRLFQRYNWSVQLNVYNVLRGNELLPVRVNPDGTTAIWRIQEGRSWRLSSTVRF